MLRLFYLLSDCVLILLMAIRRIAFFNRNPIDGSANPNAVVIGNGPSLKEDVVRLLERASGADIYCVNYMALNELFWKLKPRYYVLADPVFWRGDVNAAVSTDNTRLTKSLHSVDWKMQVICPKAGQRSIATLLAANKHIDVVAVPKMGINLKSEKLTLWAYKLNIGAPVFINVLVLALWHAMINKKRAIDIFGADFSSFKEYHVDQKTNELYSSFSHFYKNTDAQANAGEKYVRARKKKIHTRLYQSWMSFQQMYVLSLYARRLGIKVTNRSSNSYLDCFDRE